MGSSLRDIPGAGGGRKKGRLGKVGGGAAAKPWQPVPKVAATGRGPRKRSGPALRFQGPRFEVDRFNLVLGLAFAALFVVGGIWLLRTNEVTVTSDFEDGGAVPSSGVPGLAIELSIEPTSRVAGATVSLDGTDVTADVETTDTGFIWTPPSDGLEEGTYELALEVPKAVFGSERWSMTFGVDDTPPVIEVPTPDGVGIGDELTVSGEVDERVDLTAEGEPVPVDEGGAFSVAFDTPPAGAVDFIAVDPAGNVTTLTVPVTVAPPASRAVHLSADAWGDDALRDGALALLDGPAVDSIVLDVKDECGIVTHGSGVELAGQVGAVDERYDLEDAIATVQHHGGRLIARVVTFRDPLLARWAWANNHADWVLQDTADDPWPAYGDGEGCPEATNAPTIVGGFTNFASPAVQDYNIALAEEAAALGADQVLFDDVRRPDGDATFMQVPGRIGTNGETLVDFLGRSQQAVRAEGAYLGATVTGLSVQDPSEYDQDVAAMAPVVDYLSPEIYPESLSSGAFGVADPQSSPGAAVEGAVNAVDEQLGEMATPVVPWLQDYSSAVTYGVVEVQAQVDGAAAAGSCSWIMGDVEFTYTTGITPAC